MTAAAASSPTCSPAGHGRLAGGRASPRRCAAWCRLTGAAAGALELPAAARRADRSWWPARAGAADWLRAIVSEPAAPAAPEAGPGASAERPSCFRAAARGRRAARWASWSCSAGPAPRGAVALPAELRPRARGGHRAGVAAAAAHAPAGRARRHHAPARLRHSVDDVLRVFADGLGAAGGVRLAGRGAARPRAPGVRGRSTCWRARSTARRRATPHAAATERCWRSVVASGAPVRIDDLARADGARGEPAGPRGRGLPLGGAGPAGGRAACSAPSRWPRGARAPSTTRDVEIAGRARPPAGLGDRAAAAARGGPAAGRGAGRALRTSQLITARLDVASVLDRISRSVTALIGAHRLRDRAPRRGRDRLVHAAAHGFQSDEWRALSMPVGEGIIGRCAESGVAIRVDDVRADPRSARRDVDEREGIRVDAVRAAAGGRRAHRRDLGVLRRGRRPSRRTTSGCWRPSPSRRASPSRTRGCSRRASAAPARRARSSRPGRAVTASLDVARTIRVIMEQARGVLGVDSCGVMTLDPVTGELTLVASLDLPARCWLGVRVSARRGHRRAAPCRSARPCRAPTSSTTRACAIRELRAAERASARCMAAPLRVGDRAIGAISVFRRDVHQFSAAEEELLVALADQAAIALEHARLYEGAGGDGRRAHARARRAEALRRGGAGDAARSASSSSTPPCAWSGPTARARARWACDPAIRAPLHAPAAAGAGGGRSRPSCGSAFAAGEVARSGGGDGRRRRARSASGSPRRRCRAPRATRAHLVLLVEDITLAKRLERQMLLTERLTTAGRLAAGVAHELNNPLATIAGCAEALQGATQARAPSPAAPELADFPTYLGLIEEEAYRCKEITGQPAAVRARPGQPPRADRSERARAEDDRAALPPVALRRGRVLDRARPRAARGDRQRGPAPPGVPRPGLQRARGDGGQRHADHPHRAARGARSRSSSRTRGRGFPRKSLAAHLRSVLHHQAARAGDRARARHRPGHRHRSRRADRGEIARRARAASSAWCCRRERARSACWWPTTRGTCAS